jgi:protein TonB
MEVRMSDELFRTIAARRPSGGRRLGGLPLSVAFHAVALVAAVTVPLVAGTIVLPPPRAPVVWELPVMRAVVIPDSPVPPPGSHPRVAAGPAPAPYPVESPPALTPEDGLVRTLQVSSVADWVHPTGVAFEELPGVVVADPVPPPPAITRPLPIGGDVQAPRKVVCPPPIYPRPAMAARVEGTVTIEAVIGVDGRVKQARLVGSVPLLDAAALAAVRQWVFTPTLLNGVPVPVVMTVRVEFKLR